METLVGKTGRISPNRLYSLALEPRAIPSKKLNILPRSTPFTKGPCADARHYSAVRSISPAVRTTCRENRSLYE